MKLGLFSAVSRTAHQETWSTTLFHYGPSEVEEDFPPPTSSYLLTPDPFEAEAETDRCPEESRLQAHAPRGEQASPVHVLSTPTQTFPFSQDDLQTRLLSNASSAFMTVGAGARTCIHV